jgi:hypothetical protein
MRVSAAVCGRRPIRRATSFAGCVPMALPSRSTCPEIGERSRESPRRRVDLPHAFGPMITVKDLSGTAADKSVMMGSSPYPRARSTARSLEDLACCSGTGGGVRCVVSGTTADLLDEGDDEVDASD